MKGYIVKGAIVGGLIAFLWSIFSWTAIGWPSWVFKSFSNEEKVAAVIRQNVNESGVYLLPNPYVDSCEKGSIQKKSLYKNGPVVFATVQAHGIKNMKRSLLLSIITEVVSAGFITWALLKTKPMRYWQRAFFVFILGGVLVTLVNLLPGFYWKGYPLSYTLISAFDLMIGWALAGLALAKITAKANK
jgi:hypothetical protein